MHPRVGPPRDRQRHTLQPQDHTESALDLRLNGAQSRLLRPPRKFAPVVFEDELCVQTSSSSTISVESDRRGPSFRIRLYPPGRSEYRGAISSNSL